MKLSYLIGEDNKPIYSIEELSSDDMAIIRMSVEHFYLFCKCSDDVSERIELLINALR